MNWSFRLARVLGTDIKVHVTFVLLLLFYGVVSWQEGGPEVAIRFSGLILALFLCVVLHEFGHILMARRFGIRTPDVLLLPIGGVARLERMPEEPRQELLIAAAGPLVTLLIAGGLYAYVKLTGIGPLPREEALQRLDYPNALLWTNLVLLVFNLIPAFPMDGGRIFRALLSRRMGAVKATRIAANVGQFLAMLLGMWGLVSGNLVLAVLAMFVFFGAGAEAQAVETRAAGRGIVVDQMMITKFVPIPIYATLREAVDRLLESEQREFPVVDNGGRVEGLLTRDDLIRGLAARGPDTPVELAMTRPVELLPMGLDFETALARLRHSGLPALPVVGPGGGLVGLLTMDNITDLILVRQAVRR
jgi:Zn-dependent protease/CBS domain-containing protein